MKDQFVNYELALNLKELGFDEQCFAVYINQKLIIEDDWLYSTNKDTFIESTNFTAPLWQQAIDWFRVKYKINIEIIWLPNVSKYGIVVSDINYVPKLNDGNTNFIHGKDVTNNFVKFNMYEEAREQAILKAIESIKQSY